MSDRSSVNGGAGTPNLATTQPSPVNEAAAASSLLSVNTETYQTVVSSSPPDRDQSSFHGHKELPAEANILQESQANQSEIKSLNQLIDYSHSSNVTASIQTDTLNLQPLDGSRLTSSSSGTKEINYGINLISNTSTQSFIDSDTRQQPEFTTQNTYLKTPILAHTKQQNSSTTIIKNLRSVTSNRSPDNQQPGDIIYVSSEQKPHLFDPTTNADQPKKHQRNNCDTNTCETSTTRFNFLEFTDNNDDDDDGTLLANNQNRFIPFDNDDDYLLTERDPQQSGGPLRRHNVSFYLGDTPQKNSLPRRLFNQIYGKLFANPTASDIKYNHTSSEYEDLLSERRKDRLLGRRRRTFGKTFRGGYRYSRSEISMAIMRKLFHMLFQRSTLALLGAFLIHITLGTVYTLSNANSYMTSYMRLNGSPNATYGGAVWISSLSAVGQGLSMVVGGLLEKRFSARVACFLGCALHSLSIASTSWSINYGPLAVLVTYGLLPGLGTGLAYMTPMSNGFGWYPNKRGLVAGVILAGFGIGTFVFNMVQTAFVNPTNLSPPPDANGYFTQKEILDRVPSLFVFLGSIYAMMQFVGCCLIFKPPNPHEPLKDDRPILVEQNISVREAVGRREFVVLFIVYGIITQGVLFVNAMIKEYGQLFIGNDMYLAWVGSMSSIANASGRLIWGIAIDRFSFSQCFTAITILFGSLMFLMPFEFILSSKLLYLLCTLGLFGSFSGWMSTFPVHVSRVFGRANSGVIYGLVFMAQSSGGIISAIGNHYLIDNFSRFVPFFCHVLLDIIGLTIFHLLYPK